jgi:hypothetical protein
MFLINKYKLAMKIKINNKFKKNLKNKIYLVFLTKVKNLAYYQKIIIHKLLIFKMILSIFQIKLY